MIQKNKKIKLLILLKKNLLEKFLLVLEQVLPAHLLPLVLRKNYLGKGISLNTNLTLTDDEIKGRFSVINPNFRNSDKSLNTTLESTSSDFMTQSGYKTSRTGLKLGTDFEQYNDLFVNFDVSNYYEKLETSGSASAI